MKYIEKYIHKSFLILTYLISCFPILTHGMRSIIIVLWSFLGIICIFHKVKDPGLAINEGRGALISLLLLVLPFITLTISLIYTENIDEGFKKLVQMLSLFIFPLVFFVNKNRFRPREISRIGLVFSFSVILLVFYQVFLAVQNIDFLLSDLSYAELRSNNLLNYNHISIEKVNEIRLRRFRSFCTNSVDTHTTFQGTWIGFSLFILGNSFSRKNTPTFFKILIVTVGLVLLGWMLLLSTRMPLLAFLIALITSVTIIKKLSLKFFVFLIILLTCLSLLGYVFVTPLKLRIDEIIDTQFELPTDGDKIESFNSTNVRNGIYLCSFHNMIDNPLYGVGIGDVQDELNKCYNSKIGAIIYTWDNYNSHNQFLFFFLSAGLFGGLIFILSLLFQFFKSFQKKDILYCFLVTFVALICLTENLLSRSDGVLFYAFFSGLLMFNFNRK